MSCSSPWSLHAHSLAQHGANSYLTRKKLCQAVVRRHGASCSYSLPLGQHMRCPARKLLQVVAKATPSSSNDAMNKFQQPSYRWFAFDTETTGPSITDDCVIQLAAYDVESGNDYTALVNPAYHKPDYKIRKEAAQKHGILQPLVESEGIPLQQAMAELVEFVANNTLPGQIPALAAHSGYRFHYPIMHNNLQAAAAAAKAGNLLSGTSRTAGRRRRRTTVQSQLKVVPAATAGGRSGTVSKHSATVAQQVLDSWPSNWMFHDTYLMASSIDKIDRTVPGVSPLFGYFTRESLVQSLLPPSYSEADVQPHERAYADAASIAKLLPLLLAMINSPPELQVPGGGDTRRRSRCQDKSDKLARRALLYQLHGRWLSRPWPLNYGRSKTSKGFWIPRGAVEIIKRRWQLEGYMKLKHDLSVRLCGEAFVISPTCFIDGHNHVGCVV